MKAGLMEIADIFVVNKSDRPGAELFVKNLQMMIAPASYQERPRALICKTNAVSKDGLSELTQHIEEHLLRGKEPALKYRLLAERAYYLIRNERMKDINKTDLVKEIREACVSKNFNLYRFISRFL
jgi:LAO/AO transport system kinase